MFNWTLYRQSMKGSWKQLLIFAAVLTLYAICIVWMFDPELGAALNDLTAAMPELMSAFGMKTTATTLIGFLSAYLYGFLIPVVPMVFSILGANRLLARHVDRGSMAYLLAAPVARKTVAFTQMKALVTGIFVLIVYSAGVTLLASEMLFPAALEKGKFLWLNLGALCLHLFIAGICFLCSCVFSDTKYSLGLGAGIPTVSFLLQMMANVGTQLEKVKYATFFTLFNPDGIIAGEASALWGTAALFLGAVALFAAGILVFDKKDLPI